VCQSLFVGESDRSQPSSILTGLHGSKGPIRPARAQNPQPTRIISWGTAFIVQNLDRHHVCDAYIKSESEAPVYVSSYRQRIQMGYRSGHISGSPIRLLVCEFVKGEAAGRTAWLGTRSDAPAASPLLHRNPVTGRKIPQDAPGHLSAPICRAIMVPLRSGTCPHPILHRQPGVATMHSFRRTNLRAILVQHPYEETKR
jgi:hypothetical protein